MTVSVHELSVMVVATGLVHYAAFSQQTVPALSIPLSITDGIANTTVFFGIDPFASDSIDTRFGESELPPLPPTDVFDARFVGFDIGKPLGLGTLKDFRSGEPGAVGQRIHELMFQTAPGRTVTVSWNLPGVVSAILQDVYQGSFITVQMKDKGNYTVQKPSIFNRLIMTVQYTAVSAVVSNSPDQFILYQNYPNPFNPSTMIRFRIRRLGACWVRLAVYDPTGREVGVLVNERRGPGDHAVAFDGSTVGSGAYYYRLETNGFVSTKSMVLVK